MSITNEPLNQAGQVLATVTQAKSSITWHDLSIGLWATLLAVVVALGKFLRWFFKRETERFWQDVDTRFQMQLQESMGQVNARIDNLTTSMDRKFTQQENDIKDIKLGVGKIRSHYHNTETAESSVLDEILDCLQALKTYTASKPAENTSDNIPKS